MFSVRSFISSLVLITGGGLSLVGCASRSRWDYSGEQVQQRRQSNFLTAEQIAEYPQDYAVSRILIEAFPGFWARNAAISAGSPLVVLNGVPGATVGDLRAYDVERIEVQYDAASTAYYGFRGSNGVILISTVRVKPMVADAEADSTNGH
jgi:TonB-dependent SusC/RagA subfamily outer membrane receptor